MTLMDKDTQKFFNKKMRICLLGEDSTIPQNKVVEMCRKFFELGLECNKKINSYGYNEGNAAEDAADGR